jgi:hypothetical protein
LLLLCVQLYFLLEKYYRRLQNMVKQGFTLKSTFKKSGAKPLILNLKIFIIKALFWLHFFKS